MKKLQLIGITLALLIGSAGCSKDEQGGKEKGGNPVVVSVTVKGGTGSVVSRADGAPIPGTTPESAITQIEFFVYDQNGDLDTAYPYFSPSTTSGTHTFLITAGDNKKFLVAVNQNLGAAAAKATYTLMKQELSKKMLFTSGQNDSQTAIDPSIGYAMAGEGVQSVVEGNTNNLEITVTRLLSRVRAPKVKGTAGNLELSDADLFPPSIVPDATLVEYLTEIFGQDYLDLGATPVEGLKWQYAGYVLVNGIDRSYAFQNPLDANWNPAGKAYFKTEYVAASNGATLEKVYGGGTTGDLFLSPTYTNEIFVYENYPTIISGGGNSASVFVQDEVTAFLIKGEFSATNINGGAPVTRYWRVNLIKDDVWKIFRNCVYEVTMNTINTPGFATPKEAEEDGPIVHPDESTISIDLLVAPWGFKTQGVDL